MNVEKRTLNISLMSQLPRRTPEPRLAFCLPESLVHPLPPLQVRVESNHGESRERPGKREQYFFKSRSIAFIAFRGFLPSQEDPEEHEVLRSPPEASEAEDAEQPPEEEEDGEPQEGADLARVPDEARAPLLVLGAHLGWLVVFVRTVGRMHLISPLFSLHSVQQ